jgi:hypothetical protein
VELKEGARANDELGTPQRDDLGDARPGVVEREPQGVIAAPGAVGAIRSRDQSVDFFACQVPDEASVGTLDGDGEYARGEGKGFGLAQCHETEKRAQRGEPRVSRPD